MAEIDEMRLKTERSHSYGCDYGFEEAEAVMRVMKNGAPTSGPEQKAFGEEFAAFVGAKHALPVSSCVGALHLGLLALDPVPNDEVIVPTMTFRATANVPAVQDCKVVLVDCKPTFNIDPEQIEAKITRRTKAIIPVHMCGQPCEMDEILAIAARHNIPVIEDAAHAAGAVYHGKPIGSLGDITAFSFQQSKNMSTLGEGGMVVTNNDQYLIRMKDMRGNGEGGLNYRMTDCQAAVGRAQLKRLPGFIQAREHNAAYFHRQLKNIAGLRPAEQIDQIKHAHHLCNILLDDDLTGISRDSFIKTLKERYGVACITQYAPPVHLQNYFRKKFGCKPGDFPVAEKLASQVVTLPVCPRITFEDIDYCVNAIKAVLRAGPR